MKRVRILLDVEYPVSNEEQTLSCVSFLQQQKQDNFRGNLVRQSNLLDEFDRLSERSKMIELNEEHSLSDQILTENF